MRRLPVAGDVDGSTADAALGLHEETAPRRHAVGRPTNGVEPTDIIFGAPARPSSYSMSKLYRN
jgi:hypothetical protein